MAKASCSIDGCDSPTVTRGWCVKHYNRWKSTGDPLGLKGKSPAPEPKPCGNAACDVLTSNPKFCSRRCSATVRNTGRPRTSRRCKCGSALSASKSYRYCGDAACLPLSNRDRAIASWLAGETTGLRRGGTVTAAVKWWLRQTRGDACELCGWNQVNPVTGKVPVVADHIDGNWRYNRPENLRLLCPNCDSLQPTYMSLNRGKGRGSVRQRTPHQT